MEFIIIVKVFYNFLKCVLAGFSCPKASESSRRQNDCVQIAIPSTFSPGSRSYIGYTLLIKV
ncbi:hypothetical protein BLOT_013044 [Blomia tropicalis]|nr:hypothetical protein BLOT_013044 [Blomia tropicalis]